jgi:M6 family metalloprotease-like protein
MKNLFLIYILSLNFPLFSIVPPVNKTIRLPNQMIINIKKNPSSYMPKRGFKNLIQRFQKQKQQLSKTNDSPFLKSISIAVPVLCGQYSDVNEPEWPIDEMQKKMFGDWSTGSMSDYYNEVSYGQLILTGKVYGWYPVTGDSKYYERENENTREFIRELFVTSDDSIDYGLYDNDGPDGQPNSGDDDGYVDIISLVHSGKGGEEGGNEIWSHSWQYKNYYGNPFTTNDKAVNGGYIKIDDYVIHPAKQRNGVVEIGVFCHEFGHALGLPDLYDRDDEGETSEGIGNWGLMGSGSWGGDGQSPEYPSHMCAWSKEVLGWISPVVLDENISNQIIPAVETSPVVFKLWTYGDIQPYSFQGLIGLTADVGKEYFLIENRQKISFDKKLKGSGLLIWHIDHSVSSWNDDEFHKLVDLEEADNLYDLDLERNRGDAGDLYPGQKENQTFNRISKPNSLGNNGQNSKIAILKISPSSDTMYADLEILANDIAFSKYYLDDSLGNQNGYLDPGETANLSVSLKNFGGNINSMTAVLSTEDSSVIIHDSVAVYQNVFEDASVLNDDIFKLSVMNDASVHPISCRLNILTEKGYETAVDFIVMMENINILLIDDSMNEFDQNSRSILTYYTDALNDLKFNYFDVWKNYENGIPDSSLLTQYGTIIWFTGSRTSTLNYDEQFLLEKFLKDRGDLFISSQNLGYDLVENGTESEKLFYENILHAKYIQNSATDQPVILMTGIEDDPISNDFRPYFFVTEGDGANNQTSPSIIDTDTESEAVFNYFGTGLMGKHAAIKYEGDYKLVYFAFSFEAINEFGSRNITRKDLLGKVIKWLQGGKKHDVTTVEINDAKNIILTNYILFQNYPNPFNLKTSIKYYLPEMSHVKIDVYDINGRRIDKLIEEEMIPGIHTIIWDGRNQFDQNISSGIYIYKMKVNNNAETKKMILIK